MPHAHAAALVTEPDGTLRLTTPDMTDDTYDLCSNKVVSSTMHTLLDRLTKFLPTGDTAAAYAATVEMLSIAKTMRRSPDGGPDKVVLDYRELLHREEPNSNLLRGLVSKHSRTVRLLCDEEPRVSRLGDTMIIRLGVDMGEIVKLITKAQLSGEQGKVALHAELLLVANLLMEWTRRLVCAYKTLHGDRAWCAPGQTPKVAILVNPIAKSKAFKMFGQGLGPSCAMALMHAMVPTLPYVTLPTALYVAFEVFFNVTARAGLKPSQVRFLGEAASPELLCLGRSTQLDLPPIPRRPKGEKLGAVDATGARCNERVSPEDQLDAWVAGDGDDDEREMVPVRVMLPQSVQDHLPNQTTRHETWDLNGDLYTLGESKDCLGRPPSVIDCCEGAAVVTTGNLTANAQFWFNTATMLTLADVNSAGSAVSHAVTVRWLYPYPTTRESWECDCTSSHPRQSSTRLWKRDVDLVAWTELIVRKLDELWVEEGSTMLAASSSGGRTPLAPVVRNVHAPLGMVVHRGSQQECESWEPWAPTLGCDVHFHSAKASRKAGEPWPFYAALVVDPDDLRRARLGLLAYLANRSAFSTAPAAVRDFSRYANECELASAVTRGLSYMRQTAELPKFPDVLWLLRRPLGTIDSAVDASVTAERAGTEFEFAPTYCIPGIGGNPCKQAPYEMSTALMVVLRMYDLSRPTDVRCEVRAELGAPAMPCAPLARKRGLALGLWHAVLAARRVKYPKGPNGAPVLGADPVPVPRSYMIDGALLGEGLKHILGSTVAHTLGYHNAPWRRDADPECYFRDDGMPVGAGVPAVVALEAFHRRLLLHCVMCEVNKLPDDPDAALAALDAAARGAERHADQAAGKGTPDRPTDGLFCNLARAACMVDFQGEPANYDWIPVSRQIRDIFVLRVSYEREAILAEADAARLNVVGVDQQDVGGVVRTPGRWTAWGQDPAQALRRAGVFDALQMRGVGPTWCEVELSYDRAELEVSAPDQRTDTWRDWLGSVDLAIWRRGPDADVQRQLGAMLHLPRDELPPGMLRDQPKLQVPQWWLMLQAALRNRVAIGVDGCLTRLLRDEDLKWAITDCCTKTVKVPLASDSDEPGIKVPVPRLTVMLGGALHAWCGISSATWATRCMGMSLNEAQVAMQCLDALVGHHLAWFNHQGTDTDAMLQMLRMFFHFDMDAMVDYMVGGHVPIREWLRGERHVEPVEYPERLRWWLVVMGAITTDCLHRLPGWLRNWVASAVSPWEDHDPWGQSRSAALLVATAIRLDAYDSLAWLVANQPRKFVRIALARTPEACMGIGIDRWYEMADRGTAACVGPEFGDPDWGTSLLAAIEDRLEDDRSGPLERYWRLLRDRWYASLTMPEPHPPGWELNTYAAELRERLFPRTRKVMDALKSKYANDGEEGVPAKTCQDKKSQQTLERVLRENPDLAEQLGPALGEAGFTVGERAVAARRVAEYAREYERWSGKAVELDSFARVLDAGDRLVQEIVAAIAQDPTRAVYRAMHGHHMVEGKPIDAPHVVKEVAKAVAEAVVADVLTDASRFEDESISHPVIKYVCTEWLDMPVGRSIDEYSKACREPRNGLVVARRVAEALDAWLKTGTTKARPDAVKMVKRVGGDVGRWLNEHDESRKEEERQRREAAERDQALATFNAAHERDLAEFIRLLAIAKTNRDEANYKNSERVARNLVSSAVTFLDKWAAIPASGAWPDAMQALRDEAKEVAEGAVLKKANAAAKAKEARKQANREAAAAAAVALPAIDEVEPEPAPAPAPPPPPPPIAVPKCKGKARASPVSSPEAYSPPAPPSKSPPAPSTLTKGQKKALKAKAKAAVAAAPAKELPFGATAPSDANTSYDVVKARRAAEYAREYERGLEAVEDEELALALRLSLNTASTSSAASSSGLSSAPSSSALVESPVPQVLATSAPTAQWQLDLLAQSVGVDPLPQQGELDWTVVSPDDTDDDDLDDSVSVVGSVASSVADSVASSSIDATTGERKECVFCFDKKPSGLLLPCSHMTLCYKCASEHLDKGGSCPRCFRPIDQVIHVAGIKTKKRM